jgi:predicted nucleic acid-binding protein
MAILVDASILVRVLDERSPDSTKCFAAMQKARARRGEFFICAQTAIEFWVVATRPLDVNGLGLTPVQADAALTEYERFLAALPEPPDIAARWRQLVRQHGVSGRPAHDTRLVAMMETHGIPTVLSLNVRDFRRYPSIRVISPQDVIDGTA